MKNGITTLARIEELISTIREQKNGLSNHDAVKHWSTIAIHLAATENKDCLNHFVHLGGVIFLSEWLQEAQKESSDASEGSVTSVEECVCLLLDALKKISLSKDKALHSGIDFTVKQLFCHSNKNIIEKAKILLTDWAILDDDGNKCQDSKKCDTSYNDGMECGLGTIEAKTFVASSSKENSGKVNLESEKQVSIHLNDDLRHIMKGTEAFISNENVTKTISLVDVDGKLTENISSLEESSVCPMQGILSTSINVDAMTESSQKTASDGATGMEIEKGNMAVSCISDHNGAFTVSSISPDALISVNNIDSEDLAAKESTEVRNGQYKVQESTENTSQCQQIGETVESGSSGLSKIKKEQKSETLYFDTDHLGITPKENCRPRLKERKKAKSKKPSTKFMAKTGTSAFDDKRSDIALEYEDDALEFAVQVAKEAKREVVDREQCSSSCEGSSDDEIMESESEDSEKDKYDENGQSVSASKSSHANDSSENNSRENSDNGRDKDHVQEVESPKVVSDIQESVGCAVEMKCIFDLNVEPDLNHDNNLLMPVSRVNVHNAASSSAMSTLNFEGDLKATTNHLLETAPDCETMLPNNNKKLKIFSIDLNISEGEDDVHLNQVVEKKLPFLSDLPSRECSVEIISKNPEKLNLDLNSFGDDESLPTPPKAHWRQPEIFDRRHQNEIFGSKTSSFSSRQPVMREIDLNDTLFKSSFNDEKSQDTSKFEDPVITIMGSRMTVERKESKPESISQTQNHQPFLVNRLVSMESVGIRPSMSYSHSPYAGYGQSEFALGPSALSLSPAFYSPDTFPYTADSRHSNAIPQIYGSSPGMQNPLSYRPPFLVSAAGVPPGLNSIGSFQPDFDLNSGPLSLGSGSKEIMAPQTAAGSSLSLKRKEPDCERGEPYPFGYKQMTLWH